VGGCLGWGVGRRPGFEFGDLELLERRETGSETSHLSRSRDLGIKTWMGLGPQNLDRSWFGQYSRGPLDVMAMRPESRSANL